MPLISLGIINSTNILTKISILTSRINVNFEITVVLNVITFDVVTSNLIFDFVSSLDGFQLDTLSKLNNIIVEGYTSIDEYPENRSLISNRFPVVNSDNLNGYNIGDTLINTIDNISYICYRNNTSNALWRSSVNIVDSVGTNYAYYNNIDSTVSIIGVADTVVGWDSGPVESNGAVASLVSGTIRLLLVGCYRINLDMSYDRVDVDLQFRTVNRTRLSDDGGTTFITTSSFYTYHLDTADGKDSGHLTLIYDNVSPPNDISIHVTRLTGNATSIPIEDGCRAYVQRVTIT